MAGVTLTYACAHSETETMPRRNAAYRQKQAAERSCFACVCEAENQQASPGAQKSGLPLLLGKSARQVAYGETCRANCLVEILDMAMPMYEAPRTRQWLASHAGAGFGEYCWMLYPEEEALNVHRPWDQRPDEHTERRPGKP